MNKKFEVIGNEAFVTDEWNDTKVRPCYNNIEEVLITENNIEEINNLIKNEESYRKYEKIKLFNGSLYFGCASTNLLAGTLNLTKNNLIAAGVLQLVAGSLFTINGSGNFFPSRKKLKVSKQKLSLLEDELIKEELKLSELNKDKSNDAMFIADGVKRISTSEEIKDLKDKLQAMQSFNYNKMKYTRYYKKGILNEKLKNVFFNENEINYIEAFVKNQIENKKKVKKL